MHVAPSLHWPTYRVAAVSSSLHCLEGGRISLASLLGRWFSRYYNKVPPPSLPLPLHCPPPSLPLPLHCPSPLLAPPPSLPLPLPCPSPFTAPPSLPLPLHCPSPLLAPPPSLPLTLPSPLCLSRAHLLEALFAGSLQVWLAAPLPPGQAHAVRGAGGAHQPPTPPTVVLANKGCELLSADHTLLAHRVGDPHRSLGALLGACREGQWMTGLSPHHSTEWFTSSSCHCSCSTYIIMSVTVKQPVSGETNGNNQWQCHRSINSMKCSHTSAHTRPLCIPPKQLFSLQWLCRLHPPPPWLHCVSHLLLAASLE